MLTFVIFFKTLFILNSLLYASRVFLGNFGCVCFPLCVWPCTAKVWVQGSMQRVLTGIHPSTLQACVPFLFLSRHLFQHAALPNFQGSEEVWGLSCLLSCIQHCVVYVSDLNHFWAWQACLCWKSGLKCVFFSITKLVIIVLEVGFVCFSVLAGPARALPVLVGLCVSWLSVKTLPQQLASQLGLFIPSNNSPESVLKTTPSSGRAQWQWKHSSLKNKMFLLHTHACLHHS